MITAKELRDMLAYCNDDTEVKMYIKDEGKKVCFWYFAIKDVQLNQDGLFIELE